MSALPFDYRERRGDSVLLVWGDLPYWLTVDRDADRFIRELIEGTSPAAALDTVPDRPGIERDAARIITNLKRVGVIGNRRQRPPKQRIESISVNVTNRCNLNCTYCYNRDHVDSGDELSGEEMIEALEGVRRWTVRDGSLALLGGEPLLEPERTLALSEWAKRRHLTPILSTNGVLVTEEFAEEAAQIGIDCQVSIDGARAEDHDEIRGAGTFEKAIDGVKMFRDAGAHTIISMVFYPENVEQIPGYLRMAHDLGINEARFIPIKAIAGGGEYMMPDLAAVVRLIYDAAAREPELANVLGRDYVSILSETCRVCSPRQGCGTGSQTFMLDADGTVYPCINLAQPEMAVGDVRRRPLRDIWRNSERLKEVRHEVAVDNRTACQDCFVRYWCMGGCRGETYNNTGRLDAPCVTCAENREAIIETLWALSRHPELLSIGPAHCG